MALEYLLISAIKAQQSFLSIVSQIFLKLYLLIFSDFIICMRKDLVYEIDKPFFLKIVKDFIAHYTDRLKFCLASKFKITTKENVYHTMDWGKSFILF